MKTVYKMLHSDGSIHAIHRWAQELLAYSFTCVHRPNSMMVDVDFLSRCYNLLVAKYVVVANKYRIRDMNNRVDVYSSTAFDSLLLNNKYTLKPSTKTQIRSL